MRWLFVKAEETADLIIYYYGFESDVTDGVIVYDKRTKKHTKTVSIPTDGKRMDFRLTKPDAFSGAALLRMLSSMPEGENAANFFS